MQIFYLIISQDPDFLEKWCLSCWVGQKCSVDEPFDTNSPIGRRWCGMLIIYRDGVYSCYLAGHGPTEYRHYRIYRLGEKYLNYAILECFIVNLVCTNRK